jgi:hypothetical protein
VIELDRLWEEQGGGRRSAEEVRAEIEAIKQREEWIVEGVCGELAQHFFDGTDYLIWLDLPWMTCREGIQSRGYKSGAQSDPAKTEESLDERLAWAEGYWQRTDLSSYVGHQELFDGFTGYKDRIVFHGCAEALWDD